jgi:hypothetical protein
MVDDQASWIPTDGRRAAGGPPGFLISDRRAGARVRPARLLHLLVASPLAGPAAGPRPARGADPTLAVTVASLKGPDPFLDFQQAGLRTATLGGWAM